MVTSHHRVFCLGTPLTTSSFVSNVVLLSEGKLPTFATGTTKWLRIVAQGNFFLQQFARERGIDWSYYYDPAYSFGTVTANQSFEVPEEVAKVSQQEGDFVRITHTDGNYTDYSIVSHDRLKDYPSGNYCARVGSDLRFNVAFSATSPQLGGTIGVPVYLYPDTFSADGEDINHPDPNWLVLAVAADRVKNDVTRKDLRADLVGQANEIMLGLKEDNDAQITKAFTGDSPTEHTEEVWWL